MCFKLNQTWPGKLSYLSDTELKSKFAWRSMRFKNPFLGFEDDLKYRQFRLLTDPELKLDRQPVLPPLTTGFFEKADFDFFMHVKHNMYEASVRRAFNDTEELRGASTVIDTENPTSLKNKLFLDMYVKALKKQKQLAFDKKPEKEEDFSKKPLSLSSLWSKNKQTFSQIVDERHAKKHLTDVYAVLFPALGKEEKKDKDDIGPIRDASDMEDLVFFNSLRGVSDTVTLNAIKKSITIEQDDSYWTEDNIPYFILNYNTGAVDYDFWNNTDERVAKRIKSFEDFKKGLKTLSDLKAEELEITLPQLRGLYGLYDYVLLRQLDFNHLNSNNIKEHLPFFMQVYNWFQNPSTAAAYDKTVFGLIGPTLTPHWCLIFTMTKTRKNLYFTVADMVGKVLFTASAGSLNITRKKRLSPHALEPLYEKVIGCFKKMKIKNVILVMKFKAKYMYMHTLNFFRSHRISVRVIIDRFPVPHNGIRSRKKKRL